MLLILTQINPVHASHLTSWGAHFTIILSSTLESPKWFLYLRFPHQNPKHTTPLSHTATCHHLIFLRLNIRILFCEQYRSLSSSLRSLLPYPITSSFLGPNSLLSTLFSNILSLHSFFNMTDQVSHPGDIDVRKYNCVD